MRARAAEGQRPISIHALLAESDSFGPAYQDQAQAISIHALLAESDTATHTTTATDSKFLSTLSLRRATVHEPGRLAGILISIHALLAESDHNRY